jgi:ribosomal protein L11 methyltransferase
MIRIQKVETAQQDQQFDIVIANVNRHIIEANMEALSYAGKPHSELILSGLLIEDRNDMIHLAQDYGWTYQTHKIMNGWISMYFSRP